MPTAAQLSNRPTSGVDRLQQDFLDLDVVSLCEIFRLKSQQEEASLLFEKRRLSIFIQVSDFSFSFGQTDVCEGLIAWMEHDRSAPHCLISLGSLISLRLNLHAHIAGRPDRHTYTS